MIYYIISYYVKLSEIIVYCIMIYHFYTIYISVYMTLWMVIFF